MTAVCRSAIFHLRNISSIRRYLTAAATEHVFHAFDASRLDIGNALLYRLPLKQMQRLQKLQNWAARLIDRAFSVAAPRLWNALPQHLTLSTMTTAAFKVKLKDFSFYKYILYSAVSNECWNSAIEM